MLTRDGCPRGVVRMEVHGEVLNAMVDIPKNIVGVDQPYFCRGLMGPREDLRERGVLGFEKESTHEVSW